VEWFTDWSDINHQADRHHVSFLEPFGLAHCRLHRHYVPSILGEQRRCPPGSPDLSRDWDHAPAIAHERGRLFQLEALLVRYRDKVPGRRTLPVPDQAGELEVHRK